MKTYMLNTSVTSDMADFYNTEWVHEHIFYIDSSGTMRNIGYSWEGVLQDTKDIKDFFFSGSINVYSGDPRQNYNPINWQENSLANIVSPFKQGSKYHLRNHNCQDFCSQIIGQ